LCRPGDVLPAVLQDREKTREVLEVCEDILPDIEEVASGPHIEAIAPVLNEIVRIAHSAFFQGIGGLRCVSVAKQVLFESLDDRLHKMDTIASAQEVERRTSSDFGILAQLVSDDLTYRVPYLARLGDIKKIGADGKDRDKILLSRRDLQLATAIRDQACPVPYCLPRTRAIVEAFCGSDEEFDKAVEQIERAVQSPRYNLHQRAHLFDGASEAFAIRYWLHGKDPTDYSNALKYLGKAVNLSERAKKEEVNCPDFLGGCFV
jgi:hypothetical protein